MIKFLKHFVSIINFSQSYNGPESIEFNPSTESYFISNSNNGQILELDSNNEYQFSSNLKWTSWLRNSRQCSCL